MLFYFDYYIKKTFAVIIPIVFLNLIYFLILSLFGSGFAKLNLTM